MMSRPATRAAVREAAWLAISATPTLSLRKKRVNRTSWARFPARRRMQEPGRRTRAACNDAPLFPGDDRQIVPAQPPSTYNRPPQDRYPLGNQSLPSSATKKRCVHSIAGEPGFLATVAREKIPANLTPASGCQDHTALPSAEEFAGDGSGIVPGSTNSRGFMLQFRRERWFDSGLRVIDVRLAYDSPPASIFAASQPSIVARRSSL